MYFSENSPGNFPQPYLVRDLGLHLSFINTQICLLIRAKTECNFNWILLFYER